MKLNKLLIGFYLSLTAGFSGNTYAATSSNFTPLQLPGVCNAGFSTEPSWEQIGSLFSSGFSIAGSISGFTPISIIGSTLGELDNIGNIYNPPGMADQSLCIQGMLSEINTEFKSVLAQIRQIHTVMNLNDTFILEEINENSNTDLSLAYQNYIEQIANVIGEDNYQAMGAYQNFINIIGFEETGENQGSIPDLLTDLAKSQLLASAYEDNSDALQQAFFNVSGVEFDRDDCDDAPQNCVSFLKPAALQSGESSLSESPLINVLNAARAELYTKISSTLSANVSLMSQSSPNIASQANIVELYPPYNQFITSLFHQSLSAITASYYMLKTANNINALKAANAGFVISDEDYYMPDVVYIPGTYYKPIPIGSNTLSEAQSQNEQALEQANLYLDTFYAGLVNQLYENILSYMVTDDPVKNQLSANEAEIWPAATNDIIYTTVVNGQTEYWTMPDEPTVNGYACYKTIGGNTSYGSVLTTTIWADQKLSYDQCNSQYNNQDSSLSLLKQADGSSSSGNVYACQGPKTASIDKFYAGCYAWGQASTEGVLLNYTAFSPIRAKPPGATIINQNALNQTDIDSKADNIDMPDETTVKGYACLKATSTYNATNTDVEFTNWENQNLTYSKCFEQYTKQVSDLTVTVKAESTGSATKFVDCFNGSNFTNGCYIWGELTKESPDDTYGISTYIPWGQLPPGGTQSSSSGMSVIIKNPINYGGIVASNVFKPSNNPPPVSGSSVIGADEPGNPYFQLNDTLRENTFIYQAPQIREVNKCISAYISAAENGMSVGDYFASDNFEESCPSFFPAQYLLSSGDLTTTPPTSSTASTYTSTSPVISTMTGGPNLGNDDDSAASEIFAPMYYDASTGKVEQYGKIYGVVSACQSSTELFAYKPSLETATATNGTPYATCRLWKTDPDFTQESLMQTSIAKSSVGVGNEAMASLYNETFNTNGSGGYVNPTGWSLPKPATNSSLPEVGSIYVLGTSFTPTKPGYAGPYFLAPNDAGMQENIVPISTVGNAQSISSITATNMNQNSTVTAHSIALSVEIDGFYYPINWVFYHRNGLAGNGNAILQNPILNNVGFIDSGEATPITSQFKTIRASQANTLPYGYHAYNNSYYDQGMSTTLYAYDRTPFIVNAYESIDYNDISISPSNQIFTIINGLAFYVNGSAFHNWTSGSSSASNLLFYGAWGEPNNNDWHIWIEYNTAQECEPSTMPGDGKYCGNGPLKNPGE